ncbi:MAG: F0F1 ATP synthase subunit A [Oscillospiraceae bacterium]|jgi:F-type H+-transporting ATPase subunit a|nr:F0F1 ATP synthase subunit A [Oscillospiraceae bacterium]
MTPQLLAREFNPQGPLYHKIADIGGFQFIISETIIVQWLVVLAWGIIFFILGRNLKERPESRRQVAAEFLVTFFITTVVENMGENYRKLTVYIGPLLCFSLLSNLMGLLGFRSPTSDVSMIAAWGIITFFMVQINKFRTGGIGGLGSSLLQPVFFMLPFNIVSEFSNPLSQTLRHFANILAGGVIGGLVYFALSGIVPGGWTAIGIPAALSLYFDIFSGVIQAYIFAMLTISYVASADMA